MATKSTVDAGEIDAGAPMAAGDVLGPRFAFAFGVYTSSPVRVDAEAELRVLTKGKTLSIVSRLPGTPPDRPTLVLQHPSLAVAPAPTAAQLQYGAKGLSEGQKKEMAGAADVLSLFFVGPARDARATYRLALDVAATLARKTGGLLWDADTRQAFTTTSWLARLDGWQDPMFPLASNHIAIHVYKEGELRRLVSLGMQRFGLPDVSVDQVSSHDADAMSGLVELLCQTLVEKSFVDQPEAFRLSIDGLRNDAARSSLRARLSERATGVATVRLAEAAPHEGDSENGLLEIVFPGAASSLNERHNATLGRLFGTHDDLVGVTHDAELLEASKRAREAVLALKPQFTNGPPELSRLLVDAPFETSAGRREWMWIEVVRWEGSTIQGILQNDPFDVPGLHAGARVSANEDAIFDYIYRRSDGTEEGNETARIIAARKK